MLAVLLPLCLTCSQTPATPIEVYEAENQETSGRVIGPERMFGTVAAEASGRRAVQLDGSDQFIRFGLAAPARGLTIRYSLPAGSDWRRKPSIILIKENGQALTRVQLTSGYTAQLVVHPGGARPVHHFWDEVRLLLPRSLAAGTTLSLSLAGDDGTEAIAIDLIDTEEVGPPKGPPQGAVSLAQFGADPTGRRSSRDALVHAISAARQQHRPLYIPAGRYGVDGHVEVDRVTIAGAGSWHSIIAGHQLGLYSARRGSSSVTLSGFALESDISKRQDRRPLAAIGGAFSNSSFTHLYLHHAKVGIWLDGPAHDLVISDIVIADQAADGINLHRGIRNALVESNRIRNTGDDAIASWSDRISNEAIVIRNNQITAPGLANGIAIYGGRNITVAGNRVADVLVEGGGIHLGARFRATPFAGRILVADNVVVRAATMDPNWHFGVGAIWIYALERPIRADIEILRNRIEDARCEAVQLLGPDRIDGVRVEDLRIAGPLTSVFALQTGGSMVAASVTADGAPSNPEVEVPTAFVLGPGYGNWGWAARTVQTPRPPACH
jgi:hypothetical protein